MKLDKGGDPQRRPDSEHEADFGLAASRALAEVSAWFTEEPYGPVSAAAEMSCARIIAAGRALLAAGWSSREAGAVVRLATIGLLEGLENELAGLSGEPDGRRGRPKDQDWPPGREAQLLARVETALRVNPGIPVAKAVQMIESEYGVTTLQEHDSLYQRVVRLKREQEVAVNKFNELDST